MADRGGIDCTGEDTGGKVFGDTSSWTAEDHAAANAERERDLTALREEKWAEPEVIDYQGPQYGQGYLDGLEDGVAAAERLAVARRAGRRRAFRLAIAAGLAWLVGSAAGDTLGALARWVDES